MFKVNNKDTILFPMGRGPYMENEITMELDKILITKDYHHTLFNIYEMGNEILKHDYHIKCTLKIIDKSKNWIDIGCIKISKEYIITDICIYEGFLDNYNNIKTLYEKYIGKDVILFTFIRINHNDDLGTVRLGGVDSDSLVNGKGLRRVLFFQGCSLNCKGCFNDCTHDFEGGEEFRIGNIIGDIDKDSLIDGVTYSGGNPIEQPEALYKILYYSRMRERDSWVYSGYTFEELLELSYTNKYIHGILHFTDVLVDGRFVQEEYEDGLKYKGSRNQRIINVKETLRTGNIVEWEDKYDGKTE